MDHSDQIPPGDSFSSKTKVLDLYEEMEEEDYFLSSPSGQFYKITQSIRLGSDPEADICLDFKSVSPQQCKIYRHRNDLYVLDLGSPQVTKVNQKKLGPGELRLLTYGDQINIGDVKLEIHKEIPLVLEVVTKKKKEIIEIKQDKEMIEAWKKLPGKNKEKEEEKEKKLTLLERIQGGFQNFIKGVRLYLKVFYKAPVEEDYYPASAKVRICGFFLDGIFACILDVVWDLGNFEVPSVLEPLQSSLASLLEPLPLLRAVPWMPLFFSRAFFFLFLGVSLGQYLMGIRPTSYGGGILGKIPGLIRFVLEIVLWPFLIFDLPCLFGYPTIKELVSRSFLRRKYLIIKNEPPPAQAPMPSHPLPDSKKSKAPKLDEEGKEDLDPDSEKVRKKPFLQKIRSLLKTLKKWTKWISFSLLGTAGLAGLYFLVRPYFSTHDASTERAPSLPASVIRDLSISPPAKTNKRATVRASIHCDFQKICLNLSRLKNTLLFPMPGKRPELVFYQYSPNSPHSQNRTFLITTKPGPDLKAEFQKYEDQNFFFPPLFPEVSEALTTGILTIQGKDQLRFFLGNLLLMDTLTSWERFQIFGPQTESAVELKKALVKLSPRGSGPADIFQIQGTLHFLITDQVHTHPTHWYLVPLTLGASSMIEGKDLPKDLFLDFFHNRAPAKAEDAPSASTLAHLVLALQVGDRLKGLPKNPEKLQDMVLQLLTQYQTYIKGTQDQKAQAILQAAAEAYGKFFGHANSSGFQEKVNRILPPPPPLPLPPEEEIFQ